MQDYDHSKIEKKWQRAWEKAKVFQAKNNDKKPKFYGLIEFPYPSGDGLHVGHIRSNTAMDAITRKRRMEGFNVLYPIGWDAFGLPTENYAIKTGIHPTIVTKQNTDTFRRQLKELGFGFDWDREINTTDPKYYKWTQWIFLQLLNHGLAYKKKMPINWCPKDKIGLANEEVVDGCCERCGTPVEKRDKEQWMLAITKYADRLDKDLDTVDFLEKIKIQQRNWIGKSEGAEIEFKVQSSKFKGEGAEKKKVLIGTRNEAKILMIKSCFEGISGIELVSLKDLPAIDDSELKEGNDCIENAKRKSEFYFKKTGIPTISTDHILWIEKWPKDNGIIHHIRELANPKNKATDEEVIDFLLRFLNKNGGSSKSHFVYAVAYTDQSGTIVDNEIPSEYILQTERSKDFWPGYPIESMLKDVETGVFKSEQKNEVRYAKVTKLFRDVFVPKIIKENKVKVFTTRPDTLFGCTYLVLAPEHPFVTNNLQLTTNNKEVEEYIKKAKKKTEMERSEEGREKTGVELKGLKAINPANGEEISIWIADYVLAEYGTGAIMAVPAHDERDFQFANKYNLPIHYVVAEERKATTTNIAFRENEPVIERNVIRAVVQHWSEDKYLVLKWSNDDWRTFISGGIENGESSVEAARREILEETGYTNAEFVGEIGGPIRALFYAPGKKQNRADIQQGLLFKLKNDERKEVSEIEQAKHFAEWVPFSESDSIFNATLVDQVLIKRIQTGKIGPYLDAGVIINSSKFDGMSSEEAKWKIAEAVGGKKVTKYKLRDWVFSRQHYWGEPIPVVFCPTCFAKENNVNAIIVHGCPSNVENAKDSKKRTYDKHWIPWTKKQLEKLSIKTENPYMPEPRQASYEAWKRAFEKLNVTEKTILIGHSCGTAFLVRWLGETKRKILGLILVAPWKIPYGNSEEKKKFYTYDIDPEIKNRISNIIIFTSNNEEEDGKKSVKIFQDALEARTIDLKDRGHYTLEDMGTKEFPEIIDLIRSFTFSVVPVPAKDLPVELPKVEKYLPTDTGESPLASIKSFVDTRCPQCGGPAKRETDTMPNWAGSSWYYLRYIDPKNKKEFASREKLNYWLGACPVRSLEGSQSVSTSNGVDWYNGGMEHTTLHLLYSRFWHKFLFDLGLVPTNEPYKKRTSHGLILAEGGVKMSKSKGNVINPDDLIKRFGADALRVYEMFMGPFDQPIAWSIDGIVGTRRFIEKVWRIGQKLTTNNQQPTTKLNAGRSTLDATIHRTIKKVGEDIESMRFNTAISALMICANEMDSADSVSKELFGMFIKILSPFAPHVAEELWSQMGNPPLRGRYGWAGKTLLATEDWPKYDASKIADEFVTIVVQVNGKVRGQFEAAADILEPEAIEKAKALPELQSWISGKEVKKAIFVKGRLVNLVV